MDQRAVILKLDVLPPSETFVYEQARALQRFEPTLAGLERSSPSHPLNDMKVAILHAGPRPRSASWRWRLARRLGWEPRLIARWLASQEPSILHVHFGVDLVRLWPALRLLNLPIATTLHGYDIQTRAEWWDSGRAGPEMIGYYDRLRQVAQDPRIHFVAVSKAVEARALAVGIPADKIAVRYIGVDTQRFRPEGPPVGERPPVVLFVGRLVEKKGCEWLLGAARQVQASVPGLEVRIAGFGPLEESLRQQAASLGVTARFLGRLEPRQIREELARARAFCLPSVRAESGDAEGFGIVLMEAQAAGVPIVTSACGGRDEGMVHGATGFAFAERDTPALAEHLTRLMTDDEIATRFGHAARAFAVEHFDLVRCTAKLEVLFEELLGRHRGTG